MILDQWKTFAEFTAAEQATGGPDPHMNCVGEIARQAGLGWLSTAWLGALYCAVYNVPTALALHREFPDPEAVEKTRTLEWLRSNWKGITFRPERKTVRTPERLSKCLDSFAAFVRRLDKATDRWSKITSAADRFEQAFLDVQTVYSIGRYASEKYLEYGRRFCAFGVEVEDIRAKGGWSPREGLALLFPEHAEVITGGDDPETVGLVEDMAAVALKRLQKEWSVKLDFYNFQVMLCDYKQAAVGRHNYPGKSHDKELYYDAVITPHWGTVAVDMYRARAELFPHWALGEFAGWTGIRDELSKVLVDHGYVWTDAVYDWACSPDLSRPTEHGHPPAPPRGQSSFSLAP
jgi:hypothetical protein